MADTPPRLTVLAAQTRVQVDHEGRVVGVRPDPELPDAINQAIRNTVVQWRFRPPMKDGLPVDGVTFLQVNACAVPEGANFRLSVAYRGNGPARVGDDKPQFPRAAMLRGLSAKLRLDFTVLTDGSARVDRLDFIESPKDRRTGNDFLQSVRTWIEKSRFEPEQLGGVPVETKVSGPVSFMSSNERVYSRAEAAKKIDHEQQAWAADQDACKAAMATERKPADHPVAVDSPFQLLPPSG